MPGATQPQTREPPVADTVRITKREPTPQELAALIAVLARLTAGTRSAPGRKRPAA
ncbi:hypothetical protein CFN78_16505 [Amycolatopsis antarctica]|uniref:Acyl-CoA carboxylase subunit epsilon n=1 Tax=Amycolatopsis antarctica TaxID=1854586 RepID=A0A263D444_9PSEU|nr:hypothetical protein CFN78_16505 [Amycolatopsis antarctica]